MQTTLLHSKITVPRTSLEAIERQRLVNALQHKNAKKLTILRAPAGYGKTTLLSQWFNQLEEPVAWLSIDAADNDPLHFGRYFIHMLSNAFTNERDSKLLALIHDQSPFELLIDSLLNEINSIQETLHIVIEDYHLIENPTIHEMLTRFIEYLPENARIYITSRMELPLPIAKWRAKAWLTEIGVEQLRFTYDEMKHLYTKRGFSQDSTESLQHVLNRTEGWATGIQLAGLAGSTSTGESHIETLNNAQPAITAFLLQEILASLSPSTQDFLVRTSILNQLEPAICDALMNRNDSYHILSELEQSGLFIMRVHANQPIFRYHHLFADALQIEMKNRYSPEAISSIYQDVVHLIHEQGDFHSAIELALNGRLYAIADTFMTMHLVDIFTSGEASTFTRWVQHLLGHGYPVNVETLVINVITLATTHELEQASQLIEELERRHTLDQWMEQADHQGIAQILESITAFVLYANGGNLEQVFRIMQKQLESGHISTKWDDVPVRYNRFEPTLLRTSIGVKGRLLLGTTAIPLSSLFRDSELKERNVIGFNYGVSAETLYEGNYLYAALIETEAALRRGHLFEDPGLFTPMYILKGRIHATKQQFTEAHAVLDYAMALTNNEHWRNLLRTMKAHCYLLEGDISQAERLLSNSTNINSPQIEAGQEFGLLVHVRILLAKQQAGKGLLAAIRVKTKALKEKQISTIVEATMLESICYMHIGHENEALITLHEALEHAAPYGYIRTFLDESDAIPLLKKYLKIRQNRLSAHWDAVPLAYIENLIAIAHSETVQAHPIADLLTPREQEVLQLLASGVPNSEIARQLTLTTGTVRIYLSKIYSKLGVNSRTQAVLWLKDQEH
ncbi:LuxR C-terminal-related transcriptional regulator [Sporosarcina sp. FSL K6-1522]|uniref:LuxR C-terminal-related transcriptional regulator n=1 Tax=Sporosarcina sp. FSL K6-1522 TaxID=2921554 RepID=UPI00315B1209